jgi:hypothetical protein
MTNSHYHLDPIPVYAYKLGHTVGQQHKSRTEIKLVNEKKGRFRLEVKDGHPLTEYDIIIDDPSSLGFQYAKGDEALDNRIRDLLLLAMNLELREVVISPASLKLPQYGWSTNGIKERTHAILGMGQP